MTTSRNRNAFGRTKDAPRVNAFGQPVAEAAKPGTLPKLDGLTVDQLRDLVAEATELIDQHDKEAADVTEARKAANRTQRELKASAAPTEPGRATMRITETNAGGIIGKA